MRAGKVIADDADEINRGEKTGPDRGIRSGAAEQIGVLLNLRFDGIEGDGTNNKDGHPPQMQNRGSDDKEFSSSGLGISQLQPAIGTSDGTDYEAPRTPRSCSPRGASGHFFVISSIASAKALPSRMKKRPSPLS